MNVRADDAVAEHEAATRVDRVEPDHVTVAGDAADGQPGRQGNHAGKPRGDLVHRGGVAAEIARDDA